MVIINSLCIIIIYYILIRKSAKNVLGLGFLKCEYEVFQKFSESKQNILKQDIWKRHFGLWERFKQLFGMW